MRLLVSRRDRADQAPPEDGSGPRLESDQIRPNQGMRVSWSTVGGRPRRCRAFIKELDTDAWLWERGRRGHSHLTIRPVLACGRQRVAREVRGR